MQIQSNDSEANKWPLALVRQRVHYKWFLVVVVVVVCSLQGGIRGKEDGGGGGINVGATASTSNEG